MIARGYGGRMETVRWGIIGVGDVTEAKSGPGFQRAERSELVAVMRRDGARAADYAARHGVARWYDDAESLIRDEEVDAVYIATPPDSHRDYALRVLAAGKPVYVEKPMARTAAECQEMVAAAEQAGLPLFVAYYRRALPRFAEVSRLLGSGAIGEVRAFTVRHLRPPEPVGRGELPWRLRPEVSGGGLFVDLASHTLDLLDHLLGPVVRTQGQATTGGGVAPAEDTVVGVFELASGAVGSGLWCYAADEYRDEVAIVGSSGSLRFSVFGQEPVEVSCGERTWRVQASQPAAVQQPLIQSVVDELTGRGTCPSTGASALRTARVIDALLAEHRAAHGITFD